MLVTDLLRVDGVVENKILEKELSSFWNIKSLGIVEDEDLVQKQFKDHVSFEICSISLQWKDSCLSLPDDFELSRRRLNSLFRRLKKNPDILARYDAVIREQLESGIVVPVDHHESTQNCIHYIPHHAVLRHDKTTTKLRVVYDASAKTDGLSLNECLFIGPSLNKKILDILLKFRMYPIAIVGDIERAFLMVRITKNDQDVLRFLWYKDVNVESPEIVEYKFTRVVFGLGPSPYLLNATFAQHLEQFEDLFENTVNRIRESLYVDDVVMGVSEALELHKESKEIFLKGVLI